MADSGDKPQFNVYLGAWTNWSRGRILGATLTLEPRYGLLLLSFTATFVGFVASRFWRIITLILHRIYSTPDPRDALHHQRQVVLRNSLSAVSTLCTSLQLAWCWRAVADSYLARTLPTIIFAAASFCAFTIAGGFTSSISTGIGTDVLIDGTHCGSLPIVPWSGDELSVVFPWVSQSANNAANYAQQCYTSNATGTLDCTTFVKEHLDFSSVLNASCPFHDGICRSDDSNLFLDSGLISTDDLGLNMPSSQRMYYREAIHCAPLETNGFSSNASTEHENYTRYWYGGQPNYYDSAVLNWTIEVKSLEAQYRTQADGFLRTTNQGFNLLAYLAEIANETVWAPASNFIPIPQLTVPDADLLLVFISPEGVYFTNRTEDPWYRGIEPLGTYYFMAGQHDMYRPDEAASPMGCVQRFQYCNSKKECGKFASWFDAFTSAMVLFNQDPTDYWTGTHRLLTDPITARWAMFQSLITSATSLGYLLNTLGSSSLLSTQHLVLGLMGPLPSHQWQLDIIHWFSVRLASLQAAFVSNARGATDESMLPYLQTTRNKYQMAMCNNQKILSTDYISLSLFGLYFTYVTGIIAILVSYAAEPLLALFYSRRRYQEYKYLEWAANGTLQLQRLAYQGLGSEKWTNYTDDIPKTRPGYFLADLARAYPPKDGKDNKIQEEKSPTTAASMTTPSVSEASANLSVSEQSRGVPSLQILTIPDLIPHHVPPIWQAGQPSPQAVSPHHDPRAATARLQAVLPNPHAVSPTSQGVSPISQSSSAPGSQDHRPARNLAEFAGQMQNSPRVGRRGERSVVPTDRMPGYF